MDEERRRDLDHAIAVGLSRTRHQMLFERITAGSTSFTNGQLGVTATTESCTSTATTRDPAGNLVGLRSGLGPLLLPGRRPRLGGGAHRCVGGSESLLRLRPYGVTTETTSSSMVNPWNYAGQYQDDATGLYEMGARYYQPELSRWTQPDPSGQEANAYLYVGGTRVNFIDPSGLFRITEKNPNGSCRSIARVVERAFVPPECCAIFRYPDGSCFGGNAAEVLDRALEKAGPAAVPESAVAAGAGARIGFTATAPLGGVSAILGAPTSALIGCVGALGAGAALRGLS